MGFNNSFAFTKELSEIFTVHLKGIIKSCNFLSLLESIADTIKMNE